MTIDAEFEEIEETAGDSGELDLSDTDSLPWLEADEEDDNAGGVDKAQIVGFAVVLIALGLGIVGAVYLMTNRGGDPEFVADGSTIEAPAGPIKERPEDPGGKEFAGTGNVAPAVSEGQTPETSVADGGAASGAADGAGTDSGQASSGQSGDSGSGDAGTSAASSASNAYVQLAAYGTRSRAESGWSSLSRQTSALSGKRYRVVEAVVGGATVYRLQVVAGSRSEATELCRAIKADGLDCAVK